MIDALAQVKLCALALSHGTGDDGGICSTLSEDNQIDLHVEPWDIGLALCGIIVLLEQGTELGEVTRKKSLEDEPAETGEDEDDEPESREVNRAGGQSRAGSSTPGGSVSSGESPIGQSRNTSHTHRTKRGALASHATTGTCSPQSKNWTADR